MKRHYQTMTTKKWAKEIFPGIYVIGNDASDTGGNQALLIERLNHTYLIFTDGFDYGSWVGKRYELTGEEAKQVMNWEGDSYDLAKWAENLHKRDTNGISNSRIKNN